MMESIKARPIASGTGLLAEWLVSGDGFGGLGSFLSYPNAFTKLDEILVSRMEVGLITVASLSKRFLVKKPLKNLGEPKKDEIAEGFLVGESNEVRSAMRACLVVTALDLFLSISNPLRSVNFQANLWEQIKLEITGKKTPTFLSLKRINKSLSKAQI